MLADLGGILNPTDVLVLLRVRAPYRPRLSSDKTLRRLQNLLGKAPYSFRLTYSGQT